MLPMKRLLYLSVLTVGEIRTGLAGLSQGKRGTHLETWLDVDFHARFAERIVLTDGAIALPAISSALRFRS
jgi:hypothetical protein